MHQSVLDWLHDPKSDRQLQQRARLVIWQMFAQGAPTQIKSVRGDGRGWLRSDLGGNHGHQFYLWWARAGAPPLKACSLERDEVLVRAVRHHDKTHQALDPGVRAEWFPLDASELDAFALSPTLLPSQEAVLRAKGSARMVRGQPGTGKTTVLARAALAIGATRVLYLTYSERLAVRAREYFREFAPSGVAVQVSTFRELFRALADAWTPHSPVVDDDDLVAEADRLARELEVLPQRCAPWEGRCDALHAELHAYYAGAALPETFRGSPACGPEGFSVADYVALRKGAIGERAATVAARVGRYLTERDALSAVAPGPWQARKLLDEARNGAVMPTSIADVHAVVVDEVQDLTRVEAALLVEVAHAIGRTRGERVELIVAGDEGQTVRPTDFEWGVLADLITRRFEAVESFDLLGNMRSPRALVSVVHRTWDLYLRIAKDQRPRGRSSADIEESVAGRVVRCVVRNDAELARLAEAFAELPRAAFVHPGARLPDGYRTGVVETFGSATAKGLDFSVVAVIGAGRHIASAFSHAAQGATEPLHVALARTMTDQLRVAVSRSSDTLVFVDRDGEPGSSEVDRLVRGHEGEDADGFLGTMQVDDLIALLDRSEASAEELVNEYLVDVRGALDERPRWALERARRARGLLGRSDSKVGVADLSLRSEVMRLQGVAAVRVAVAPGTGDGERRELFAEANRALHAAKLSDAGAAALWLRDLRETPAGAADDARRLVAALSKLDEQVPEWSRFLRDELAHWCERCASVDLPPGPRALSELVEVVEAVAALLRHERGSLASSVEQLRARSVSALLDAKQPAPALQIVRRMADAAPLLEARCHEALGDLTRATDLYERAGALTDALRCARGLADVARSVGLAEALDVSELDALRAFRALLDALEHVTPFASHLTDGEVALLWRRVEEAVPMRKARRGAKGA